MSYKVSCDKCDNVINVDANSNDSEINCVCGNIISLSQHDTQITAMIDNSSSQSENRDMDTEVTGILNPEESNDNQNTIANTSISNSPSQVCVGNQKSFGNYEIISELGRGGMGVVYKARDPKLNRVVALKVLLAGDGASEDQIMRFHREAESVAKLSHPNIIPIYDIGQEGNQHYFTMDFTDGEPLDKYVKENKLKTNQSIEIMQKVASAISYCHDKGILHRDMKPANVIIDKNGEPHIMDFGLAKATEVQDTKLTQTGMIMGTPAYLSPEQGESAKDIDGRTDIWSMGIMLYEMLCGETPFQGESAMEIITKVCMDDPTPLNQKKKVSTDINTVTMKCLEKDRNERYTTAKDFADDLQRYLDGEPITAIPPSSMKVIVRKIKKHKALTAAFFIVLLVAGSAFYVVNNVLKESADSQKAAQERLKKASNETKQTKERLDQEKQAKLLVQTKRQIDLLSEDFNINILAITENKINELKRYKDVPGAESYIITLLKDKDESKVRMAVEFCIETGVTNEFTTIYDLLSANNASDELKIIVLDKVENHKELIPSLMELGKTTLENKTFRDKLYMAIAKADNGKDLLLKIDKEVPQKNKTSFDAALTEVDKVNTFSKYVKQLDSDDHKERIYAIKYVKEYQMKMAYSKIENLAFNDPNKEVRLEAAKVLNTLYYPLQTIKLINTIKEESKPKLRKAYAYLLGKNPPRGDDIIPFLNYLEAENNKEFIDIYFSGAGGVITRNKSVNGYPAPYAQYPVEAISVALDTYYKNKTTKVKAACLNIINYVVSNTKYPKTIEKNIVKLLNEESNMELMFNACYILMSLNKDGNLSENGWQAMYDALQREDSSLGFGLSIGSHLVYLWKDDQLTEKGIAVLIDAMHNHKNIKTRIHIVNAILRQSSKSGRYLPDNAFIEVSKILTNSKDNNFKSQVAKSMLTKSSVGGLHEECLSSLLKYLDKEWFENMILSRIPPASSRTYITKDAIPLYILMLKKTGIKEKKDYIIQVLKNKTKEDYGEDFDAWQKWWEENKNTVE